MLSKRLNVIYPEEPCSTSEKERLTDAYDTFNHPRYRRNQIVQALKKNSNSNDQIIISFCHPSSPCADVTGLYRRVHSDGLLKFLVTCWDRWVKIGPDRRDSCYTPDTPTTEEVPPLIPGHCALHRETDSQRPGNNVMGAIAYYCTDRLTPIVSSLVKELSWDAATVKMAVGQAVSSNDIAYALTTHPGHHAAYDSFGGYCYLNHAALAARLFQERLSHLHQINTNVAILDVDYHCGNGTASIFYRDPSVLVVSIHCDPEWEYPFNSGFADQRGKLEGLGTTLHFPLPPGTTWEESYKLTLQKAIQAIQSHDAQALVVSLGLDTHDGDPVTTKGGGFRLKGQDYFHMGNIIGSSQLPTVVVQEGGYKLDVVGETVSNFLLGLAHT